MFIVRHIFFLFCLIALQPLWASDFDTHVPMRDGGKSTYYVEGKLDGYGDVEFMVDTGSGYLAINEETLAVLEGNGNARYVKDLRGVLADGGQLVVPVYTLNGLYLGKECRLNDVEAAVFPGKTRLILGLSALTKAAPFIFSVDPPHLMLSNCDVAPKT
jgi:predicted aspartyl protease